MDPAASDHKIGNIPVEYARIEGNDKELLVLYKEKISSCILGKVHFDTAPGRGGGVSSLLGRGKETIQLDSDKQVYVAQSQIASLNTELNKLIDGCPSDSASPPEIDAFLIKVSQYYKQIDKDFPELSNKIIIGVPHTQHGKTDLPLEALTAIKKKLEAFQRIPGFETKISPAVMNRIESLQTYFTSATSLRSYTLSFEADQKMPGNSTLRFKGSAISSGQHTHEKKEGTIEEFAFDRTEHMDPDTAKVTVHYGAETHKSITAMQKAMQAVKECPDEPEAIKNVIHQVAQWMQQELPDRGHHAGYVSPPFLEQTINCASAIEARDLLAQMFGKIPNFVENPPAHLMNAIDARLNLAVARIKVLKAPTDFPIEAKFHSDMNDAEVEFQEGGVPIDHIDFSIGYAGERGSPFGDITQKGLPKGVHPIQYTERNVIYLSPQETFEGTLEGGQHGDAKRREQPGHVELAAGTGDFLYEMAGRAACAVADTTGHNYIRKDPLNGAALGAFHTLIRELGQDSLQSGAHSSLIEFLLSGEALKPYLNKDGNLQINKLIEKFGNKIRDNINETLIAMKQKAALTMTEGSPERKKVDDLTFGDVWDHLFSALNFAAEEKISTPLYLMHRTLEAKSKEKKDLDPKNTNEGLGKASTYTAYEVLEGKSGEKYLSGLSVGDSTVVAVYIDPQGQLQTVAPLVGAHSIREEKLSDNSKTTASEAAEIGSTIAKKQVVHYALPKKGKLILMAMTDGVYEHLTNAQDKARVHDTARTKCVSIIGELVKRNMKDGKPNLEGINRALVAHAYAGCPHWRRIAEVDDVTSHLSLIDLGRK